MRGGSSIPTILGTRSGNVTTITGLQPKTNYYVYARYVATVSSFASEWKLYTFSQYTGSLTYLDAGTSKAEYQWTSGFSLSFDDILATVVGKNAAGKTVLKGEAFALTSVTDEQGRTVMSLTIYDAGKYTVTVVLKAGYEDYALNAGKDSFTIEVKQLPFSATVSMNGYVYGGNVSTPRLNDYAGDGEVTFYYRAQGEGDDAWAEWKDISADTLAPGGYELKASVTETINSIGGDTQPVSFTVSRASLGVSIAMSGYTYGGAVPTPALVPATSGLSVEWAYRGADGVEHPWQNITGTTLSAGSYTIIARIAASALYEEVELTASFTVNKAAAPAIQWPTAQGIVYGQKLSEAALSATSDGHGSFAWANPDAILDAGEQTATLVYTPNDARNYNYAGVELTKEIAVTVSTRPVEGDADFAIAPIPDQTYTGAALKPQVTVMDGERVLVEGEDYEVAYADNILAGTATVTITGKGNYSGTATATFQIAKAPAPAIQWPEVTGGITYGQRAADVALSAMADANGTFAWQYPDYVPGAGEQLLVLVYTPGDAANYDYSDVALTCELSVEVAPKAISGLSVDAIPAQTATGSALTPDVTVRDGDAVLAEGVDYTVTYSGNTQPGTATVTITGTGNYSGTLTLTSTIREAAKDDEDDEDEQGDTEALTPAQQAERLASGEAVGSIVTDRQGEPALYAPSTVELLDEETQQVLKRTLILTAAPLLDEEGEPVLDEEGQPIYEQRNLHLSRGLLDALAERGYTHIRFALKGAALEWAIADMPDDGYVVRLAPMEEDELSATEREAVAGRELLTGSYRARITAALEDKEADETYVADVTDALPSLKALFAEEAVREPAEGEAAEGELAQLLLVPGDSELEAQLSAAQHTPATEQEPARYEAQLAASGLFAMTIEAPLCAAAARAAAAALFARR